MPRIFGHDLLAIIAAAVGVYAVGFVIYGLLFSEYWMTLEGVSEADFSGHEWKMALGPIMPVVTTLSLAKLLEISGRGTLTGHLQIGFFAWLGFSFMTLMYEYAYGVSTPFAAIILDGAHLLIGTLAASAILVWRKLG